MAGTRVERAFCGRLDHGGCGVLVEITDGRITGIKGNPDTPVNRGRLCPKGPAVIERIYHPDRLTTPLKRTGPRGDGNWAEISWDEALETIAGRMTGYKNEFGAESILMAQGSPRGIEYQLTYRLAGALGTPNVATTGSLCFAPRWGAALLTAGFYPKPDVENSKCIMVWGNNATDTSADGVMGFQVRRAMDKGAHTIVIDPKKTALAARADLWLRIKPGTDGALALGMVNYILSEGLHDQDFVEQWVDGFERLKVHARDYTLEKVSEITWIPEQQIKEAARRYATTKPASILWGNGLEHTVNSVQNNRSMITLMALTGNLNQTGGNVDPHTSQVRSPGELILGTKQKELRTHMIGKEYQMARMLGFVPGAAAIRAILEDDPYAVKMMYIHNSNPMVSYANSKRVHAALNRLDFLAVSELFMTPTAALADVVLPAATNYEFNDLGHYGIPWGGLHVRPKLVEPVGQCWPDIKIINELGKRLGFDEYFWTNVDECLDFILEPSGHDYESFKAVMALGPDRDYEEKEGGGFRTRSGKIEIFSPAMEKWQAPPLAEYSEPAEPDERYPYVLASGKDRAFFHTALRNIPSLRKLTPKPPVLVHSDLARERGLCEGQEAIIETAIGSIKQYVVLDDSLDPRVVYADYGWWFAEKGVDDLYGWQDSNINILTDDTRFVEPLIGTTTQRGMYCNIRSTAK